MNPQKLQDDELTEQNENNENSGQTYNLKQVTKQVDKGSYFMEVLCNKIVTAFLITLILIYLDIENNKLKPGELNEVIKQYEGIFQLHLYRNKIKMRKQHIKKWKPVSYLPLQSTKKLQVKADVEFSVGYDLKEVQIQKTTDKYGLSRTHIHLGELKVLSRGIIQQRIEEEQNGLFNKWSVMQRNQCLQNTYLLMQARVMEQIKNNKTHLQQLKNKGQRGLIPLKKAFEQRRPYAVFQFTDNMVKYFDIFLNLFNFKNKNGKFPSNQQKHHSNYREKKIKQKQIIKLEQVKQQVSGISWLNLSYLYNLNFSEFFWKNSQNQTLRQKQNNEKKEKRSKNK